MSPKAIFVANTGFSLFNFRMPLMQYLAERGWNVIGIANDEADYGSKFEKSGFRLINLSIDHKGRNPFKDIAFTIKLAAIYRNESPDLVHHFTIKPVIFGSLASKFVNIPSIINTITGVGYIFQKGGVIKHLSLLLYKISLMGRPKVIFQNTNDYELFHSNGLIKKDQAHVILGSGINISEIRPGKTNKNNSNIKFLIVARMLWSKGIAEFVSAAKKVLKQFPETKFIMIGGVSGGGSAGNPDAIPDRWLHAVTDCENINWVGRLTFEEVIQHIEQCSIFVLPSYREGLSRSLIEAAAKGKAIITSDTPGCREVVKNGVNGFLVPTKDVDALADCMFKLIRKPHLIKKMGNERRKIAVELFDEQKVFEKTARVYIDAGVHL